MLLGICGNWTIRSRAHSVKCHVNCDSVFVMIMDVNQTFLAN